jgi:RNA polymerase sigma-70 factor, ECF subfamily
MAQPIGAEPTVARDARDDVPHDALVARIRAGDVAAFEDVFRAYRAPLARLATRITASPELGDEVVHDVFLKIWRTRATWSAGSNLTAHLFAVTRNAASSVARRRRLEARWSVAPDSDAEITDIVDAAPGPDHVAEARDRESALVDAVRLLPTRSREAFLLRWREQLTYPEIAAAMGISVKTVEKQLGAAFRTLRRALRPWIP